MYIGSSCWAEPIYDTEALIASGTLRHRQWEILLRPVVTNNCVCSRPPDEGPVNVNCSSRSRDIFGCAGLAASWPDLELSTQLNSGSPYRPKWELPPLHLFPPGSSGRQARIISPKHRNQLETAYSKSHLNRAEGDLKNHFLDAPSLFLIRETQANRSDRCFLSLFAPGSVWPLEPTDGLEAGEQQGKQEQMVPVQGQAFLLPLYDHAVTR